ncbi:cation:proton antiporter [Janibacter sp. GXQ6167]|uniref:cation:proton antiporter n=1 Tax=Janibacter sp. GXQ6167 TaxID=3240791 RepID=UPI003523677A
MQTWEIIAEIVAAILVISGALWVLVSAVAIRRVPDALSRINSLSPATGMGLTSIVAGAWVHKLAQVGFDLTGTIKMVITIIALLLVSSVASNTLSRAAVMSGAKVDPRTNPDDLYEPETHNEPAASDRDH